MVDIFNDLSSLGLPVFAEGDAPENLPNEYYTVNEDYSADNLNADNEPKEYRYEFSLKYYTNNAETLYTGLINALEELKSKGYIVSGRGYANSTYQSGQKIWFSRQADIKKIEYL